MVVAVLEWISASPYRSVVAGLEVINERAFLPLFTLLCLTLTPYAFSSPYAFSASGTFFCLALTPYALAYTIGQYQELSDYYERSYAAIQASAWPVPMCVSRALRICGTYR